MRITKEKAEAIAELRKAGKSVKEIAKEYEVAETTIRYWIKRLKESGIDVPKGEVGRPAIKLNQ